MNRGYVKVWRKSLDKGWIRNHKLWAFLSWCLLKASYNEFDAVVGRQIVHLMPGQFIFGLKRASEETGLTIREIRTILYTLIFTHFLTIKTTNKFSVITIVNWPTYQGDNRENDKQSDKPATNKRQHTRSKEVKTFSSDSSEIRLASLLLERIVSRLPGFKKPDLQKWAVEIDRMIRIDERPPEEIRRVIEWCQTDDFWQNNILSAGKLRKQFDQLRAKMPRPSPTPDSDHEAPRPVTCPGCGRSVLSTDMDGAVCIRCASQGAAHA